MRIKKWHVALLILLFLALTVFLFRWEILGWIVKKYDKYIDDMRALPTEGTYYCEELDVELEFYGIEIYMNIPQEDSRSLRLFTNFHDGFFVHVGYDGPLVARGYFHWDQKKDVVTLQFNLFPNDFDTKVKYAFVRQE